MYLVGTNLEIFLPESLKEVEFRLVSLATSNFIIALVTPPKSDKIFFSLSYISSSFKVFKNLKICFNSYLIMYKITSTENI